MSREDLRAMEAELNASIMASYGPPKKYKPGSNHASKIGHPCAFYLWARRALWQEIPSVDEVVRAIFGLGNEHEKAVSARLLQEGWNVTKAQASFHDEELDIGAKMDFELSHDAKPLWKVPVPTEFKSASDTYFGSINSFDDLFLSSIRWVRLWPTQALFYGHLDEKDHELVALLMRNKTTGVPKTLITEVVEHGEHIEEVEHKLRVVNECLAAEVEAPCIEYDPMWCKDCEAKHVCPAMRSVKIEPGHHILESSGRIDSVADLYLSTKEDAKANKDAWADLKETVKGLGAWDGKPNTDTVLIGKRYRYTAHRTAKRTTLEVDRV